MTKNVFKKTSIILASLALVAPLVLSMNTSSVSASHRSVRTMRVSHRYTGRAVSKHVRHHAHHYYKFAYDKKEYKTAISRIKRNRKMYWHIADKLVKKAPKRANKNIYKRGIFDAYGRFCNKRLTHNKSYKVGYVMGIHDLSGYMMTTKDAIGYYNNSAKYGVGMPNYIMHFKRLAHYNLLN